MTHSIPAHTRLVIFMGCSDRSPLFAIGSKLLQDRPHLELLVIEKSEAIYRDAFLKHPGSSFLKDSRVQFFAGLEGEKLLKSLQNYFFEAKRAAYVNAISVLVDPQLTKADEAYYRQIETAANKIFQSSLATFGDSVQDNFDGLINMLQNRKTIFSAPDISILKNKFKGIPAIVVASGPSLDKDIALLQDCENRALLIATNSALQPLLAQGIKPHIVTALERSPIVGEFFEKTGQLKDVCLAACPVVVPEVFSHFGGPRLLIYRDVAFPNLFEVEKAYALGPTVGNLCFTVAALLGCDPIILVGQDLAYSPDDLRSHVRGTLFKEREQSNDPAKLRASGFIEIETNGGRRTLTEPVLQDAQVWYENEILQTRTNCINTATDGAKIKGSRYKILADCLSDELKQKRPELRERILEAALTQEASPKNSARENNFSKRIEFAQSWAKKSVEAIETLLKTSADTNDFISKAKSMDEFYISFVNDHEGFAQNVGNLFNSLLFRVDLDKNALAREFGSGEAFAKALSGYYEKVFAEFKDWLQKLIALLARLHK